MPELMTTFHFFTLQRPLPERPPEQNNEYYEPAEAGVQIKQSEDNELYSLYSSITNLNPE